MNMSPRFADQAPRTVKEILKELRDRWASMREKRDRALSRKRLTQQDGKMLRLLDGLDIAYPYFPASDGRSRSRYVRYLLKALKKLHAHADGMQFLHVTIFNARWDTSDEQTELDLVAIADLCANILDELSPDWLGAIELQAWANRRHHSGGKILCPNGHFIVFGHDILAMAHTVVEQWNGKLVSGIPDIAPVKVDLIAAEFIDLARVARYPLKAIDRCKTFYLGAERSSIHESEKGDRFVRFFRIFQLLSLIDQRQLLLASGDGKRIQNKALARTRRWRRDHMQRFLASNDVVDFWREFMPRIRLPRFQMPEFCAHSLAADT